MIKFCFDERRKILVKIVKRGGIYHIHECYLINITSKDTIKYHFRRIPIARYKRMPYYADFNADSPEEFLEDCWRANPKMFSFKS